MRSKWNAKSTRKRGREKETKTFHVGQKKSRKVNAR